MSSVEKATIKEFANQIVRISPDLRKIAVGVLVERLQEEHGIEIEDQTLLEMCE
jgi:hypothetical protein